MQLGGCQFSESKGYTWQTHLQPLRISVGSRLPTVPTSLLMGPGKVGDSWADSTVQLPLPHGPPPPVSSSKVPGAHL